MKCPLCDKDRIKKLELINRYDLIKLYKKKTKIDFSYLINHDIDYCECENCQLRFYNPMITGDEKFYNALQKFDWYYMDKKEEFKYAKKFIANDAKVLEVGSGKGAFAKHINTKKYIGLETSENAKKMATQNGIKIENETIQDFSKRHKNEFDVVVSFQVLEHVSNPKSFIESQLEVLNGEGKVIIAVPSEDSFVKYISNGFLNMPPHHVTRWSDATFKYIASKYNLKIETIYHEKVQEVHKKLYLDTLVSNSISKNKLIDLSLRKKNINKFSSLISKLFIINGLADEMLPNGHTVLVVFKK